MSHDVVSELKKLWAELRSGVNAVDPQSPQAEVEALLERVGVVAGVEAQTVYPELEDRDPLGDVATSKASARWDKIQAAMEKLTFPLDEKAWGTFEKALTVHLDASPQDLGARLEALSEDDRSELGELARTMREGLE